MYSPWKQSRGARKRPQSAVPRLEILEERRLLSATQDDPIAEPLALTGGAEFRVNTTTAGDQLSPGITSFADGGYAILWKHNDYPTFQRYDAAGNPVGTETQTMWTKGFAAVAADGTSIVAYDSGTELRARRHDASGNSIGGSFIVNRLPLSGISGVKVYTDNDGNHTFIWHGSTTNPEMIFYRRFDCAGTPLTDQTPVGEVADYYRFFADLNSAGDLIIGYDSMYALIKGSGAVIHAPLPNPTDAEYVSAEKVDITPAGNFAVQYFRNSFVYVQRFDASGLPDGDPVDVMYTPVASGKLLLEPGGDFVLVGDRNYFGYEPGGSGQAVVAQRFRAFGTAEPAFLVNTFVAGNQRYPSAAMLNSSTFVTAWQSAGQDGSGQGVFAKRFTDDDLPKVKFVSPEEGPSISDGESLLSQVAGLRVAFSRPMNGASVESLSSWQLMDDGVDISSLIVGITYQNDMAYVSLAEPLRGTGYELIAHESIQDVLGRSIDGDDNGTSGAAYSISFDVQQGVFGVGAEQIIYGDAGNAYSQIDNAINDDGTYAVAFAIGNGWTGTEGWEARVFDASGQAIFPGVTFDYEVGPMLPLQGGEFLIGSALGFSSPRGVRSFDASGAGPLVEFETNAFGYYGPYDFVRAPDGTYIAIGSVKLTQGPSAIWDVRFQRFAADGTALGPISSVDQPAGAEEIFVFQNGEFVITWVGASTTGSGYSIRAHRFAADGSPIGEIIDVESLGRHFGTLSIAGDRAGNFTILWSDVDLGASYETRIFARRFDTEGQPLADAALLRTTLDDNIWTRRPFVVMDDSGRSLISWNEGPQLFVQGFAADGQPLTDFFQIDSEPVNEGTYAQISMNAHGEAIVSWRHSGGGLRLRRLSLGAFPVLDLNGAAEGIDFATDKDPAELLLTIVDADELTITTSSPTLVGATIQMDPALIGGELGIDVTGTNITLTYSASGVTLSGVDTVANYQQVLRSVVFAPPYSFEGGQTTEIEFTIDDGSATSPVATARVRNSAPAEVLGRHLYYAGAKYDDPLPGPHYSNAAYDTSKTAYQAGSGGSTFANVSSYTRGINGVVLFTNGDYGVPSLSDFTFKMGTSTDPGTWLDAPAPSAITFREGAGTGGTDILELTWPDGAIKNTWLEVTMLANENTGLAAADVSYFGSRVGDTGLSNSANAALTSAADQLAVRAHPAIGVGVENPYDFDRNGVVSAGDELTARFNPGILLMLNLPGAARPDALQLVSADTVPERAIFTVSEMAERSAVISALAGTVEVPVLMLSAPSVDQFSDRTIVPPLALDALAAIAIEEEVDVTLHTAVEESAPGDELLRPLLPLLDR